MYPMTPISMDTIEKATQMAQEGEGMKKSEMAIMTTAATVIVCKEISRTKINWSKKMKR